MATKLGALLQRAPTMETITEVGDQVMQATTADELLSRVERLVEP